APTRTIICPVYPSSHHVPAPIYARATKTIREEDANEASPSPISAWGRGRCRAPCPFAGRISRNISVAAGALHRFFCGGRPQRHRRAHRRPVPVGSSGTAICHLEPSRRSPQCRHALPPQPPPPWLHHPLPRPPPPPQP